MEKDGGTVLHGMNGRGNVSGQMGFFNGRGCRFLFSDFGFYRLVCLTLLVCLLVFWLTCFGFAIVIACFLLLDGYFLQFLDTRDFQGFLILLIVCCNCWVYLFYLVLFCTGVQVLYKLMVLKID